MLMSKVSVSSGMYSLGKGSQQGEYSFTYYIASHNYGNYSTD